VTTADRPNPLDTRRRKRGADCASALTLDRLALGELPEDERAVVGTHLAGCADCAALRDALEADRVQFAAQAAFPSLAADALARAETSRAPLWLRLRRLTAPLALAAVGALLLLWRAAPDENRTKGGFALSPFVVHTEGERAPALHAGEPLHPGDRVQFLYSGTQSGYLAVVAVDATGAVSVYYPPAMSTAEVTAGRNVPLSSAVELDDTLGREVIVGVRCEQPILVDAVVGAARKAAQSARARGAAVTDLGPLGLPCAETRYQIDKRQRPDR
jgi:hypothetical protein